MEDGAAAVVQNRTMASRPARPTKRNAAILNEFEEKSSRLFRPFLTGSSIEDILADQLAPFVGLCFCRMLVIGPAAAARDPRRAEKADDDIWELSVKSAVRVLYISSGKKACEKYLKEPATLQPEDRDFSSSSGVLSNTRTRQDGEMRPLVVAKVSLE